MIKTISVLACVTGLALILAAFVRAPNLGRVEAHETAVSSDGCSLREVALDEGYGVSRKVMRRVCGPSE
jgi:hypothetical protein